MKVIKNRVSLEGYSLKDVLEFKGRKYDGLSATLQKDGVDILSYIDHGDGSPARLHTYNELDKSTLFSDVKRMIKICKPTSELIIDHAKSSFVGAVEALVSVLDELDYIVKHANQLVEKACGRHYCILIIGSTYFYGKHQSTSTGLISFTAKNKTISEDEFINHVVKHAISKTNKKGDEVLGVVVLQGKYHWQLTLEDYKELFNPTL